MLKSVCQLVSSNWILTRLSLASLVRRDRGTSWKHVFQLISWAVHSALLTQSRIWVCGLIQIFPCPSMFRMSAKVVLLNSVIWDMPGGFLLMMFLYLWLMLLLVVAWITATHFSGANPSSIYANYSASKIVQPELYQIPVQHLCLRNCTGFLLNSTWHFWQPH